MSEILILSRRDLQSLMSFDDYVDAVAEGFRLLGDARTVAPGPLHIPLDNGGFHVKSASLPLAGGYVAVKVNGNFPRNRERLGLPTIQGAVLLADAANGKPLALVDSIEITIKRTGAATTVAARYLAREDSRVATICGCGEQGRIQLVALRHVLDIRRVFAWDKDPRAAAAYADEMSRELGIVVEASRDLRQSTLASDVIATCTTAAVPFLGVADVRAGSFVAAIGADNPDKSEIEPELMAKSVVVADVLAQTMEMGDLHHAIRAGAMTAAAVHAELGDLVRGVKRGRANESEITIFDGTGTGIQDVAAAARAYQLARERGVGARVEL